MSQQNIIQRGAKFFKRPFVIKLSLILGGGLNVIKFEIFTLNVEMHFFIIFSHLQFFIHSFLEESKCKYKCFF
jgi:hypothetical protein